MSTTTTPFRILYVCDLNNARSALAAAFTYYTVGRRHATDVRWHISSAGTQAAEGGGVRPEVQRAAAELQVDLSEHRTRPLDAELCDPPDLILGMAWDQVTHLWSLVPQAWGKVFTMKEFVHWAKQAPTRPPILFADRIEQMRDKVGQAHAIRKRARADHGFWGGLRPSEINLIEPEGRGDAAWATLAMAVQALVGDVVTLLLAAGVASEA